MRGQIDIETCDLSPDGQHFLYSGRNYASRTGQWTVVSRPPYLKALAYYKWRGAAGWFVNDRDYCVPCGNLDYPEDREHPEVCRVEAAPPMPSQYAARLQRGGWTIQDLPAQFAARIEFVRPAGSGWDLRHHLGGGYQLKRDELTADTSGWDWADMDDKRLVWAAKGCLWAGVVRKDGIQQIRLLRDFNGMQFEALAAPYEGGRPVQPKPPPPAPIRILRKVPRSPSRKKPDRSKAHSEDDAH